MQHWFAKHCALLYFQPHYDATKDIMILNYLILRYNNYDATWCLVRFPQPTPRSGQVWSQAGNLSTWCQTKDIFSAGEDFNGWRHRSHTSLFCFQVLKFVCWNFDAFPELIFVLTVTTDADFFPGGVMFSKECILFLRRTSLIVNIRTYCVRLK